MAIIRRVKADDGADWIRMREMLWPGSPADHRREVETYFAKRLELPVVFVAEESGRIVGFLELDLRKYAPGCASSPVAFVEGWYVDPDMRRRGIGRDLVGEAEVFARSFGSAELASDAELDNALGIAAHARLGFDEIERVVCFRRLLSEEAASPTSSRAFIRDVMPVLMCTDMRASMRFYRQLAFELLFQDDDEQPKYAVVQRDAAQVHLQWANANQWHENADRPTYRFLVDDVDRLHAEMVASTGVTNSRSPWAAPADTPWHTREFHVRDPDGNGLQFYAPLLS